MILTIQIQKDTCFPYQFIYSAVSFSFFTFSYIHFQQKLKYAERTLYSIFTLKIFIL